jgi:ABC-type nitrate/sulfonate/bicarbonate transport system permease component
MVTRNSAVEVDVAHELRLDSDRAYEGRAGRIARRALLGTAWVGPLVAFFLVWQGVVEAGWANRTLLSPPSSVFPAVWRYFSSGEIYPHLETSLRRGSTGFGLAIAIGIPLGLILGYVKPVARVLMPVVELLRQLPPLAMLPVFILFLGLGLRAQVAIVTWAAVWPILLNTISGAQAVDPRLVKAARTLGAKRFALFAKIAFPSALPTIVTGLRLGASYSLLVLISAEMVGANSGLGFLILNTQYSFHIPQMYAAILILAILGLLLNYGLLLLEYVLVPWKRHL